LDVAHGRQGGRFSRGEMSIVTGDGCIAVEKRGLDHQDVGVASGFGQPIGGLGIAHDDELLAPLWRPEDLFGIDHPTARERHWPSFRQLLAHWTVRHSKGCEAVRPKMTAADLAFEGES
jgi:hypothetical protein